MEQNHRTEMIGSVNRLIQPVMALWTALNAAHPGVMEIVAQQPHYKPPIKNKWGYHPITSFSRINMPGF